MDVAGAPMRGQVDADSKQAVSDQLRARGLVILEIAEKHRSRELNVDLFERITLADLAIFSRQLATMVSSGMTILRALFVLEEQTEVKKLKTVIVAVRKDVEAGLSFSVALGRHPKVFSPLFVAMIRGRALSQRRPVGEGGRSAPAGPIGDGLPLGRALRRADRDGGAGRLHRARLRRRAQAVRLHGVGPAASGDDPGHG